MRYSRRRIQIKTRRGLRTELTTFPHDEYGNQPRILRKSSEGSNRKPGSTVTQTAREKGVVHYVTYGERVKQPLAVAT